MYTRTLEGACLMATGEREKRKWREQHTGGMESCASSLFVVVVVSVVVVAAADAFYHFFSDACVHVKKKLAFIPSAYGESPRYRL